MIERYNQGQVFRGIVAALLSIVAYVVAFFFFKIAFAFITSSFAERISQYGNLFSILCLVVVTVAGYLHVRSGRKHYGFEESGMMVNLSAADSGGAFFTQLYANRVTTPAYLLSQVFLAGPLQAIKSRECFRSRIASEPMLESRLAAVQQQVESRPKRHSIADYPGQEQDLFLLARMDRIAFSPRKGTVFKKE